MKLEKILALSLMGALSLTSTSCEKEKPKPNRGKNQKLSSLTTVESKPTPLPELARIKGRMAPDPYDLNEKSKEVYSSSPGEYILLSPYVRGGIVNVTSEAANLLGREGYFMEVILDSNNDGRNESYFSNRVHYPNESRISTSTEFPVKFLELLGMYTSTEEDAKKRRGILSIQDIKIRMIRFDERRKIILQEVTENKLDFN